MLRHISIKESIKVKLLAALSAASLLTLHIFVCHIAVDYEQYPEICLHYCCVRPRVSDLKFTNLGR